MRNKTLYLTSPTSLLVGVLFVVFLLVASFAIPRVTYALTATEVAQQLTPRIGGPEMAQLLEYTSLDNITSLVNQTGLSNVANTINQIAQGGEVSGGAVLGQAIDTVAGSGQITQLANTILYGDFTNVGKFLNTAGATGQVVQVANAIISGNGINMGQLLSVAGANNQLGQVANALFSVGGNNFGSFLGQATCVPDGTGGCTTSGTAFTTAIAGFSDAISVASGEALNFISGLAGDLGIGEAFSFLGGLTNDLGIGEAFNFLGGLTGISGIGVNDAVGFLGGIVSGGGVSDAIGTVAGIFGSTGGTTGAVSTITNLVTTQGVTGAVSTVTDALQTGGIDGAISAVTGGISGGVVGGAGLFVPVREVSGPLLSTTQSILATNQKILENVQWLRLKEQELDSGVWNAWKDVIGQFVVNVYDFVTGQAYLGNPIFLTNTYAYFQLVDDAVFRTYLQEITDSNIGRVTKREAIIGLLQERFAYSFPYTLADQLAEDGRAAALSVDFTSAGGPEAMYELFNISGKSSISAANLARSEYLRRRTEARSYEEQKLAWGRGFYSYENCEQDIFSSYRFDRRNCLIVTPGSFIQDQVSFIFGTALRQMELADEFNENVSASTFAFLQSSLNLDGLNTYRTRTNIPTTPVGPAAIETLILPGNPNVSIENPDRIIPSEFNTLINITSNSERENRFRSLVLDQVLPAFENPDGIPILNELDI